MGCEQSLAAFVLSNCLSYDGLPTEMFSCKLNETLFWEKLFEHWNATDGPIYGEDRIIEHCEIIGAEAYPKQNRIVVTRVRLSGDKAPISEADARNWVRYQEVDGDIDQWEANLDWLDDFWTLEGHLKCGSFATIVPKDDGVQRDERWLEAYQDSLSANADNHFIGDKISPMMWNAFNDVGWRWRGYCHNKWTWISAQSELVDFVCWAYFEGIDFDKYAQEVPSLSAQPQLFPTPQQQQNNKPQQTTTTPKTNNMEQTNNKPQGWKAAPVTDINAIEVTHGKYFEAVLAIKNGENTTLRDCPRSWALEKDGALIILTIDEAAANAKHIVKFYVKDGSRPCIRTIDDDGTWDYISVPNMKAAIEGEKPINECVTPATLKRMEKRGAVAPVAATKTAPAAQTPAPQQTTQTAPAAQTPATQKTDAAGAASLCECYKHTPSGGEYLVFKTGHCVQCFNGKYTEYDAKYEDLTRAAKSNGMTLLKSIPEHFLSYVKANTPAPTAQATTPTPQPAAPQPKAEQPAQATTPTPQPKAEQPAVSDGSATAPAPQPEAKKPEAEQPAQATAPAPQPKAEQPAQPAAPTPQPEAKKPKAEQPAAPIIPLPTEIVTSKVIGGKMVVSGLTDLTAEQINIFIAGMNAMREAIRKQFKMTADGQTANENLPF